MENPFEAYVSVVRARDRLLHGTELLLRGVGLSEPQFNVLRILRGAGEPLPTSEVGRRMITRVPDITRLVDRLEAMGLVCRHRAPEGDRRRVLVEITTEGLDQISPLDDAMEQLIARQFAGLGDPRRRELISLLDRVGREA